MWLGRLQLIANPQLLTKVDARQIDAGAFTVKDILEELRKPGRDPREQFVAPSFNEKSASSPTFSRK